MIIKMNELSIDKEPLLKDLVINIITNQKLKIAFEYIDPMDGDNTYPAYLFVSSISKCKIRDVVKNPTLTVDVGGADVITGSPFNLTVGITINKSVTISGQVGGRNGQISMKLDPSSTSNIDTWRSLISMFIHQGYKNSNTKKT